MAEENPTPRPSSPTGTEDSAAAEAGPGCGESIYQARPVWDIKQRPRRPAITDDGFQMPGFAGAYYMWPEEYWMLAKYVDLTQGNYLEVGSMCGIIAMSFAQKYAQREFVCVDAFIPGHSTIAGRKDIFLQNLRDHELANVKLVEGNSLEVIPQLTGPFGIVLIDGNHAYDYVLADARNSWCLLTPGGFMVFHDYDCVEETTRAVDAFVKETGAPLVETATGLAVIRKPTGAEASQQQPSQDEVARLANELAALQRRLVDQRKEIDTLAATKSELETALHAIENSAGWQWLNRWRRLRDRLVPESTRRRRLYDSLLNRLRRSA